MVLSTQERGEARGQVICDPENLPLNLDGYEVEKFSEPFSHTIYLGLENNDFPEGFAFRIRTYSEKIANENGVGILDLDLPCFLEIKHPIEGLPGARKKIRHETTIGEAIKLAESFDQIKALFADDLPEEIFDRLSSFYEKGVKVKPVTGVSYERTHFKNGHRITLDKNISSFSIVKYDGVYFVKPASSEKYSLLEIKDLVDENQKESEISKFQISKNMAGKAVHIEPGMDMMNEGDWLLDEVELKIDTVADPREALGELTSTDDIQVGPWKEGSAPMQFLVIGEAGICIMGRKDVTANMAIKNKGAGTLVDGVLVRSERVQPYSDKALLEVVKSKGGNDVESISRTAYFTRNRAMRLVVCSETGNIFAITADRCISEDGRPDLNQTEIEYRGKISTADQQDVNEDEVNKDFQKVAKWLHREFRKKRLVPQISSLTKYQWSASEAKLELPDEFKQGNNAVITISPSGESLIKSFDLWAADEDSEELTESYLQFRSEVKDIYAVPEVSGVVQEDLSLRVEEELIDGVLGEEVFRSGSNEQITSFIKAVLLPLNGQIDFGKNIVLDKGRISKVPLKVPLDMKPDSFIVKDNGQVVFVDMFPPLNRAADGLVVPTYNRKPNQRENDTWVYGDASILITRFLMRSIIPNTENADFVTKIVLNCVKQIDSSGFLLDQLKENTAREKTIKDFSKVENGIKSLALINLA